jgi:hypothetical protein
MVQFIEKHRRLLQAYCLMARIIGWLLILGGFFWFIAIVKDFQSNVENVKKVEANFLVYITSFGPYLASSFVYDFFIPGILAFAIAGLLDYLLRPKTKPPLILGMMDKLCYIYAVLLIYKAFVRYRLVEFNFLAIAEISESAKILLLQPLLGPTLAKVLLLIGVGMILHRLLPVIEESKTLV